MKRIMFLVIAAVMAVSLIAPSSAVLAKPPAPSLGNGVDIFRGAWGGVLTTANMGDLHLNLYFNESVADAEPGWFKASGYSSLLLEEPGKPKRAKTTLLPMMAKYTQIGDSTFEIIILATFPVPTPDPGSGSVIIRLEGTAEMFGSGVTDDIIEGTWRMPGETTANSWSVNHLDRRRIKAPAIDLDDPPLDLHFRVDALAQLFGPWNEDIEKRNPLTTADAYGNIVMDSVRVTFPDGSVQIITQYTDLWSPEVDWITYYRFNNAYPGLPVAGGTYIFTALDIIGNPIPGVEETDVWVGVPPPPPPTNTSATWVDLPTAGIMASWDPISAIPGSFEPPDIGGYELEVYGGVDWAEVYAVGTIGVTSHLVPKIKADFIPNVDRGASLDEMADGTYRLDYQIFTVAPAGSAGKGLEYIARDYAQSWWFEISGGTVTTLYKTP